MNTPIICSDCGKSLARIDYVRPNWVGPSLIYRDPLCHACWVKADEEAAAIARTAIVEAEKG